MNNFNTLTYIVLVVLCFYENFNAIDCRFSSVIKTRGYKTANRFEKLQLVKKEINRIRDLSKRIVEERKREIEAKKERRRLNLQRKEANRLKSEIVQVIKNPAKIKRMRKKQLRQIEKRDTLNMK